MMVLEHPHDKTTEEVVDPLEIDEDKRTKPIEDLEQIKIDKNDETKILKIGYCLTREVRNTLLPS